MRILAQKKMKLLQGYSALLAARREASDTPEDLLSVFLDYIDLMESRVWIKSVPTRNGIETFDISPILSFQSFFVYSGVSPARFEELKALESFYDVCMLIDQTIRAQQIEGAAIGAFNAGLVQRLQGLAEKTDNKTLIDGLETIIGATFR